MMFTQRQQKILRLLEKYKNITSDELGRLIGVSSKTVRMDIKKIIPTLKKNVARVNISTRVGYSLEIINRELFVRLLDENQGNALDASGRAKYIIHKLLINALENKTICQQELADDLYVGISTLKISLKDVVKKLAKYNLAIITYKNKGMRIKGNENQIRYCISEYVFRMEDKNDKTDDLYKQLFSDIDIAIIKNIIIKVTSSYEIMFTDSSLKNLLVHILITIKRTLSGYSASYTLQESTKIEKCKEFLVARSIFVEIYRQLQIDIATDEIYYLTQHLIASKKYNDVNGQSSGYAGELVRAMLERVCLVAGMNFTQDKNLIRWLKVHLEAVIPRMRFRMNIRNEILDVIKNEYPLAFQIAIIASKVIEEREKIVVNENEIGYIAIHFGAALTRMDARNNNRKKALIICGGGIGTAVLLKARIEEYFKDLITIVKTVPGYKLKTKDCNDIDIIFTTMPLSYIKNIDDSQREKLIYVQNLLNDKERTLIQQKFFNPAEVYKTNIEKFFREDCYNIGGNFKGKNDVLEYLTTQLKNKKLIDDLTCQSVFERENTSPTEISNLVAVPHPMVNNATVSSIAVLILDKPILWVEENVQVIFLISIAKPEFCLWEPIFLKLFEYLVKENGVKEMISGQSYTEFIKIIKQKFD
ncbi:BglG family transcription antiterminator [Pectinatus cerevisiiphilus]|uniref:BglG family transcriptional antiterminator n=1 Tax=Pectinatus cerevisiiphilus TaxID=86956 RepID=A0A4R3KF23_9FIRM|nr:PRD domain-containing protein [Pectinatus cerevisiiphilus]TCS81954.1 BglG family transcriptional antiterminator [Pectinatus cerevisiiphilus]